MSMCAPRGSLARRCAAGRKALGTGLLAIAAGCGPSGAPDGAILSEVRLSGARVGTQRTWRPPGEVVQAREWSVRSGGGDYQWTTKYTASIDEEGRLLGLSVDGAPPWDPPDAPVHLLEESLPALRRALAGETVLLDGWLPAAGGIVTATLTRAGPSEVLVDTEVARAVWTVGDRVTAIRAGAVEVVEVDAFADAEPPDLLALLRLPTEAWPDAATSHHLLVRLDGVAAADVDFPPWQTAGPDGVRVDRPVAAEVPRAFFERLATLVGEVQADLAVAPRPGPPQAEAVLHSGTGDCNDHAAALVARLAAEGIDARPVTGWVYRDGPVEPGLYPHGWVESYVEPTGWVPADPMLGQPIADATHIRARDGVAVLARPAVTRVELR